MSKYVIITIATKDDIPVKLTNRIKATIDGIIGGCMVILSAY